MSDSERRATDVGDLLRAGDPYRGQRIDPVQAQRMRAIVTEAGAETGASRWTPTWRPVPVALALVAIATLVVWRAAGPPAPTPAEDQLTEASGGAVAEATGSDPDTRLTADDLARRAAAVVRTAGLAPAAPPAPERVAPLVVAATAEPATAIDSAGTTVAAAASDSRREARRLQFTAPGGTRIVWTLDPDFTAPELGAGTRSPATDSRQGDDPR